MEWRLCEMAMRELDQLEHLSKVLLHWMCRDEKPTWDEMFNTSTAIRCCTDSLRGIIGTQR